MVVSSRGEEPPSFARRGRACVHAMQSRTQDQRQRPTIAPYAPRPRRSQSVGQLERRKCECRDSTRPAPSRCAQPLIWDECELLDGIRLSLLSSFPWRPRAHLNSSASLRPEDCRELPYKTRRWPALPVSSERETCPARYVLRQNSAGGAAHCETMQPMRQIFLAGTTLPQDRNAVVRSAAAPPGQCCVRLWQHQVCLARSIE